MTIQIESAAMDELHHKSMGLADEGFYAKRSGDLQTAQEKYQLAFDYEKAAASFLMFEFQMEPTRSVYFRSAASLVLQMPEPNESYLREAERLVAFGLCGNPPVEVAEELRDTWRQIMGLMDQ